MLGADRLTFEAGQSEAPWQLPGCWVAVHCGAQEVGQMGVLAGPVLNAVAHDAQVVWFELAMDQFGGPIYPEVKHVEPAKYPGSWQDFSLVWSVDQGFAALEARLDQFAHPLVLNREFLYVYKGKGLPPGKASYSFRYWLGAHDHTLSSPEIDQFRTAFLEFLQSAGIPLR